jgi:predicted transposase YbfD/YdcC
VVAIDGKCLRGSRDSALGKSAISMVSAWASDNHLVLGQVKVDEKSNEITAIPELLAMLELAGCIVTIDAVGTQKAIAEQIVAKGADYVLAVRDNQPNLHEEIEDIFQAAKMSDFQDVPHTYAQTIDKGHGRLDTRECWATSDPRCLACLAKAGDWAGLQTVAMVTRRRRPWASEQAKVEEETTCYITSLKVDADRILEVTRRHWSIENGLHWVLDVAFDEDHCRVRRGHGPENLAIVRHFALGLLKQDTSVKVGIKGKRKAAGWDEDYLLRLVNQ